MSTKAPSSMRYEWRRLVVRDAYLTDSTRRVLLELESYANPDGTKAHPGIARIAAALRTTTQAGTVNEKTVRRALAEGVRRGLIECTYKSRGGRAGDDSDEYRLTLPAQETSPDDGVEAEDANPFDSGKHESATHSHHAPRNAETVDTQMPDALPETVDTQMSTDQTTAADIPSTNGGHLTPNGGHPDAHAPEPLHQILYQEGEHEVTHSLAEPIDSPIPPKSISVHEQSPAADAASTKDGEPSRFCDHHPNDTTESCWRCGKARERHNQWKAKQEQAKRNLRAKEVQERVKARDAARAACTVCEGKSDPEKDRCFHEPDSVEAWQRSRFQMNAARSEIQRKQGDRAHADDKTALSSRVRSGRRSGVPRFRSGSDSERFAAREELRRRLPVPVPNGLVPEDGGEAVRPQKSPAA